MLFRSGLFVTLVVHEFGHAILCRVENTRVQSIGLLIAVIPIGAFVEPDGEEVEAASRSERIRMYGAGITNNIIVGLVCFAAIVGLMGMAVPLSTPMIQGVYADSPADMAGLSQNSVIYAVNGMTVESVTDVSDILKTTAPGDALSVTRSEERRVGKECRSPWSPYQ